MVHGEQVQHAVGICPEVAAAVAAGFGRGCPCAWVWDAGEGAVDGFEGLLEAVEARGGGVDWGCHCFILIRVFVVVVVVVITGVGVSVGLDT